jgi:hypothetical protein
LNTSAARFLSRLILGETHVIAECEEEKQATRGERGRCAGGEARETQAEHGGGDEGQTRQVNGATTEMSHGEPRDEDADNGSGVEGHGEVKRNGRREAGLLEEEGRVSH